MIGCNMYESSATFYVCIAIAGSLSKGYWQWAAPGVLRLIVLSDVAEPRHADMSPKQRRLLAYPHSHSRLSPHMITTPPLSPDQSLPSLPRPALLLHLDQG